MTIVGAFVSCNGVLASALGRLCHGSAIPGGLGRVSNGSLRDPSLESGKLRERELSNSLAEFRCTENATGAALHIDRVFRSHIYQLVEAIKPIVLQIGNVRRRIDHAGGLHHRAPQRLECTAI